ncbi:MAG: NAD(P)H-hydrate dehydratase [Candidatus Eisenbacteria bacterium]|nr:NAD(P)H-hydrate dehydratase [Candidatus Eisenbacteria bacterium]
MLLLTAEEMRRLDRATIAGGHCAGPDLMERAGAGVAAAMERRYGSPLALRVLVLCGTGNNGGDGFVAARHLRARGADVTVGLLGLPDRVQDDALVHLERMRTAGLAAQPLLSEEDLALLVASREPWDFALDAVLGTGARGEPEALAATAVQALRELDEAGTRVVAVDLPTGVGADTGEIARRAVRADLTVTFGHPKRGHVLYPGRAFAGDLEVVDIGLVDDDGDPRGFHFSLATSAEMEALIPQRDPRAHKGSVGRVLVVGGSPGLTGAVALAARAASRAGAGYVQAAVPASLNDILEVKLTEEMTIPVPEAPQRTLALAALTPVLARAAEVDALVLGSGLSLGRECAELVRRLAAQAPAPFVLDADGLNAFAGAAGSPGAGAAPRVLTPHLGEMARLTGESVAALEAGRLDACREWAVRWGCVVVLKGAPTVTASADGRATVNPTGNPGMATAGMGDVLAGVIAALLAQGLAPYDAARAGVFVHGLAGDLCARDRGAVGFTAGDAAGMLPAALRELGRAGDASRGVPRTERRPAR